MTKGLNWTISYTDFFGKKKVEAFKDKDEAQARYESLLPRTYGDFGDLASVTAPIRSATKISESVLDDVDLSNQWDDLNAVIKGLFIRGFDNPSGKYFYVKSDYRKDEDACHSVYSKGTDSHLLDIHVVGAEPIVAVVNQGLQDEPFDMAYDAIELIVKDWFNMVTDGFHGVIAKIDDPSEYAVWKKSKGFKNEDGASASSLGVAPTGVVGRKNEKPTESVFDDDELERTGDQAPYRSMYAKDRKALQDALKVAQKYSPDAKIDPKKQKIVYNSPYGEVIIYTETFTGLGGSSDIQTHYEVSFIMYGHQHMTCDTLDDLDIVLKGISAGVRKHPGDSWDDFVRNVKRATRKPRAKHSEARGDGADLASVYGSGDIVTHESSADGFYVDDHDPMGWAILNNDVDTMKELFAGTAPTPDKPWLYAGWDEYTDAPADKDGSYPYRYSWDSERDLNFVEDWKRVVGETNNEEALNLLLEHDPDFIPTAIDFYNAFLAGYDKKLLRKLLDNIRAVWDKDDINDSYLNYEDFGETPYENLIEFLGE